MQNFEEIEMNGTQEGNDLRQNVEINAPSYDAIIPDLQIDAGKESDPSSFSYFRKEY